MGGGMPKPTDVKALPNHRLWLRYDDGVEGEVDLSDLAGRGVFEPLTGAAYFAAVHLGAHGAIQWSSSLDLCPDAMDSGLTGKRTQDRFRMSGVVRSPEVAEECRLPRQKAGLLALSATRENARETS